MEQLYSQETFVGAELYFFWPAGWEIHGHGPLKSDFVYIYIYIAMIVNDYEQLNIIAIAYIFNHPGIHTSG